MESASRELSFYAIKNFQNFSNFRNFAMKKPQGRLCPCLFYKIVGILKSNEKKFTLTFTWIDPSSLEKCTNKQRTNALKSNQKNSTRKKPKRNCKVVTKSSATYTKKSWRKSRSGIFFSVKIIQNQGEIINRKHKSKGLSNNTYLEENITRKTINKK